MPDFVGHLESLLTRTHTSNFSVIIVAVDSPVLLRAETSVGKMMVREPYPFGETLPSHANMENMINKLHIYI